MPQMGESIAEGTVSKWLKQVGDMVQRDEAILEISTDKVDAEIPSPSEGVLVEVLVQEGETVEVGTTVAYIDPEAVPGEAPGAGTEVAEQPEPPTTTGAEDAEPSAGSEALPAELSPAFEPLGTFHLKGFEKPERLWVNLGRPPGIRLA